jgi:CBS domain-containing protein
VEASDCGRSSPALGDGVARQSVREVMLSRPKTLPAEATVADLRRLFENPRVETALVVDGTRFVGVVDREQLDVPHSDDTPARSLARRDRVTIGPDAPVADAMDLMDETGGRRLVVVADDGVTVQGLLCLSTDRTGFCM